MNITSIEKNFYKQRKTLPRINENIKKILSKSFIFHGEVEIEIQHFSKLRLPKDTRAIGNLLIYFGDFLLRDMYLYVTPDENGRFKVKFNKMIIQEENEYLDVNKISFKVEKFHVQHSLEHKDHEKLKPLMRRFQVNIDIPELDEDEYF